MSLKGKADGCFEVRGKVTALDYILMTAYGVALKNGFEGTEQEWLDSLPSEEAILKALVKYFQDNPEEMPYTPSVDEAVTPQMFGAVGDGEADDTEAVQMALDYAGDHNTTLFFPNGKSYRITSSLVLKASNYTIKGSGVKWYHLCPDLPEYGALFVGGNYPNDWTNIELHMDGVNARPVNHNDTTTKGCTFIRGVVCRYSSRMSHCKINYFGIVFEGTITVVSTIADCQFFGIREYFMVGTYRDGNGEFVTTKEIGLLNDSKIINCYISGSRSFFPVMFGTGRFDMDAQINNCFIEFSEYVFSRRAGNKVSDSLDVQGCTLNRCIIQNCANMFESSLVSQFKFYACEFVGFSAAGSLSNYYEECTNLEERISGRKCGVYIKEPTDRTYQQKMLFENCYVTKCDYFIYLKSGSGSVYYRNERWHLYERGTVYGTSAFIENPVHIEYYREYSETFKNCWFDTLNNAHYDAVPTISVDGNAVFVQNIFNGQTIHTPDGIYVATLVDDIPTYRNIDHVDIDTTKYLGVKLYNNAIVASTPPKDIPVGVTVNMVFNSSSKEGLADLPNPNNSDQGWLTSTRIGSVAQTARQELRYRYEPNIYIRFATTESTWSDWYCLTQTKFTA